MQFVIDELEYQGMFLIVTGKTPVGAVKGIWQDQKAPKIGECYRIELSMDKPQEIKTVKQNNNTSVYVDDENVIFTGLCEDIDDEVYYLRFSIDWLDMLEIHVISDKKKKGDYISFSSNWRNIRIYPYD